MRFGRGVDLSDAVVCQRAAETLLLGGSEEAVVAAKAHQVGCGRCVGAGLTPPFSAPTPSRWKLVALGLVVLLQFLLAVPWLFGVDPWQVTSAEQSHLTRDGAVGVAVASAGFVVLWRQRYAQAGFVFGSVGLVVQAIAAGFDGSNQCLSIADELVHLISIVVVIFIGLVGISMKASQLPGPQADTMGRGLRVVSGD